MYINPFIAGIIFTILVELVLFILSAVIISDKKEDE